MKENESIINNRDEEIKINGIYKVKNTKKFKTLLVIGDIIKITSIITNDADKECFIFKMWDKDIENWTRHSWSLPKLKLQTMLEHSKLDEIIADAEYICVNELDNNNYKNKMKDIPLKIGISLYTLWTDENDVFFSLNGGLYSPCYKEDIRYTDKINFIKNTVLSIIEMPTYSCIKINKFLCKNIKDGCIIKNIKKRFKNELESNVKIIKLEKDLTCFDTEKGYANSYKIKKNSVIAYEDSGIHQITLYCNKKILYAYKEHFYICTRSYPDMMLNSNQTYKLKRSVTVYTKRDQQLVILNANTEIKYLKEIDENKDWLYIGSKNFNGNLLEVRKEELLDAIN